MKKLLILFTLLYSGHAIHDEIKREWLGCWIEAGHYAEGPKCFTGVNMRRKTLSPPTHFNKPIILTIGLL